MIKPDCTKTAEDIYIVLSLFNQEQFRIEFETFRRVSTFRVYRRLDGGKEEFFGGLQVFEEYPDGRILYSKNTDYRKSWPLMVEGFIYPYLQTKYGEFPWLEDSERLPTTGKPTGKQGPRKATRAEQEEAVLDWEKLDKGVNPMKLEDWLGWKFGYHNDGTPWVAPSTFYGWRSKFLKKS